MRVLMCPPFHFEVLEENPDVNPWMQKNRQPKVEDALNQWSKLFGIYRQLGVEVLTIEPRIGLGDMCFTANAAVRGMRDLFVMANFHPDVWWRKEEIPHYANWLTDHRFGVDYLPEYLSFEGQGSWVTLKDCYVLGWGIRDSEEVGEYLEERFRIKRIVPVQLIDPQCYHLDVAFHFARGIASIIWCPDAFDRQDVKRVERIIAREKLDSLELSIQEAVQDKGNNRRNFLVNSVYIEETEIMPWDEQFSEFPRRVRQFIENKGGRSIPLDVSEFGVSGGGARCLSLFLD